jgi:hypothetical protein
LSQSFSERDAIPEDTIQKGFLSVYLSFQKEFIQMRGIFSLADTPRRRLEKKDLERLQALGYIEN